MRLACPTIGLVNNEWRLHTPVVTMGGLLLLLGDRFSAAQIDRFFASLMHDFSFFDVFQTYVRIRQSVRRRVVLARHCKRTSDVFTHCWIFPNCVNTLKPMQTSFESISEVVVRPCLSRRRPARDGGLAIDPERPGSAAVVLVFDSTCGGMALPASLSYRFHFWLRFISHWV